MAVTRNRHNKPANPTRNLTVVYDTEIFDNAFLATFYIPASDHYEEFFFYETVERKELERLRAFLASVLVAIGFNNLGFDNLIIDKFLTTGCITQTKQLSNSIIGRDSHGKPVERGRHGNSFLNNWNTTNYDVYKILEEKGSLKEYQCRMGLERVETYDNFAYLPKEDIAAVKAYCRWDCYSTYKLWLCEETQAKLKVKEHLCDQYNIKGASRTESTFAEIILEGQIKKRLNLGKKQRIQKMRTPKMFAKGRDIIANNISFNKPELQELLTTIKEKEFKYVRNGNSGDWLNKKDHDYDIELAGIKLAMGIGGLHSKDKIIAKLSSENAQVINVDVSSYYPSTIANLNVAPTGIERHFLEIYKPLLQDRLKAKQAGKKVYADSVKIVLNAAYGKLGYVHSSIFNPISMVQVTLNCQLYFLMLLEQLEELDIEVLQVNTDGICCYVENDKMQQFDLVLQQWEKHTNYELDYDKIDGVLVKSANEYAWINDGKVTKEKGKGFKTELSLFHGCTFPLVSTLAIQQWFVDGTHPRDTVRKCFKEQQWHKFAIWRKHDREIKRYVLYTGGEKAPKGLTSWGYRIQWAKNFAHVNWSKLNLQAYEKLATDFIKKLDHNTQVEPDLFTGIPDSDTKTLNGCSNGNEATIAQPNVNKCVVEDSRAFIRSKALDTPIKTVMEKLLDHGQYYIAHQGNKESLRTKSGGRKYFVYGKNAVKFPKLSFISLNPYLHGSTTKGKGNIAHNYCVTIEYDNLTLQQQWQKLQNVPHTAIVYSGSKSLHCHIRFTQELTEAQHERLTLYLRTLFGESDQSTWRINQYVRVPGGYNYDTKAQQSILSIKDRVPYDNLLEWLEYERNSRGLDFVENTTKVTTADLKTPNLAMQLFYEHALDDILLTKGFTKSTQNSEAGENIVYTNACPRSHRHTHGKSHNGEFQIFVNATGAIGKYCHHNTCQQDGIGEMSLKDLGYGIAKTRYTSSFFKTEQFKSLGISQREFKRIRDEKPKETAIDRKIRDLKPLPIEIDPAYKKVYNHSEIENKLQNLGDGQACILSMPTGTGKSTLMLQSAKYLVEQRGERVVFVTSTLNEVQRSTQYLKYLGVKHEHIEWYVSNKNTDSDNDLGKSKTKKNAPYIITTLGYWGRKGELATVYTAFSEIIQNSVVMFDECHVMLENSIVNKQLTALYKVEGFDANKSNSFTLGNEYHICNKTKHQMSTYNERTFHKDFVIQAINRYKVEKTYGIFEPSIVEGRDITPFENAESTVFCMIPHEHNLGQKPDFLYGCKEESTYYSSLCHSLHNLHLKTELPIWKDTRKPISFYELHKILTKEREHEDFNVELLKDKFQFPKQTPFVTQMSGYDMLGFWQLTGINIQNESGKIVEYKRPKSVVFASATIPHEFESIVINLMSDTFTFEKICNERPPAKFDVTLLKASESISADNIEKIVAHLLKNRNEKALIVVPTKQKSANLFHALSGHEGIQHFTEKVYEKVQKTEGDGTQIMKDVINRIMITYPGSSICKGANLSDYQILMVDGRIFAPLSSFTCMTLENVREAQRDVSHGKLTQIAGRLLRTQLKIMVDRVIEDPRRIVMVLYGLPENLLNFSIDEELVTDTYKEYNDTWLSTRKNDVVDSVVENIANVLDGKKIRHFKLEEVNEACEKKIENMSKKERELTKETREEKRAKKIEEKFQKLLSKTQDFDTWRDFSNKNNVHNKKWLTENMLFKLKESFTN